MIWSDKVQITLGTEYEARDQFRAALTVRGLHYETVTEIPFEIELVGSGSVRNMFYGCSKLTSVPAMDTSSVTNMMYMFYNCSSLTTVPEMETWEVTDMYAMFRGCSKLTSVPAMGTSKVMDMRYMFYNCSSLTDGNAILYGRRPDVNTGSTMITNSGLTYLPFYVEQVSIPKATDNSTTARDAFRAELAARRLNHRTITFLPFDIKLTGSGNSVFDLFAYCEELTSVPSISLPGVTSTRGMFNHCRSLTSVGDLNTSNVTNMMYMFWNCSSLTDGNVRLIGRHPNVDTSVMISGSGLTYLPFDTEVSSVTLTKVYGANRVHPLLSVTVPAGKTWSVRIQGTVTLADYEGSGYPIFRIGSANSRSYWQGASVDFSGTVSAANSTIAMVTQSSENTSFSGTVTIER